MIDGDRLLTVPVQGRSTDERFTPAWVFDGLQLAFDLDPASPIGIDTYVPAARRYTRLEDGLSQPWQGLVWLNPPYSESTPWARKFIAHGNGVFLGPIANSAWLYELLTAAEVVWLLRDIAFVHPEHSGRHSSMPLVMVAIGPAGAAGLRRLATSGRHQGVLFVHDGEGAA